MKLKAAFLALALLAPAAAMAQQITPGASSMVSIGTPGTQVPLTGSTSMTNIAVIPVPALGKNGGVMVSCLWTVTSSTNAKTLAAIWSNTSGATSGFQLGTNITAAVTTIVTEQTMHIGRNMNANGAQKSFPAAANTPFGSSAAGAGAGTVDTTLPSFININGQLALGTESIAVENCFGLAATIP